MKAIFFDIDGVFVLRDRNVLEAECLQRLKEIVDATGAILVMSSSWRHYKKHRDSAIEQIARFGLKVFGWTDDLGSWTETNIVISGDDAPRWKEIQKFLDENPEIKKFAIIDDYKDACPPDMPEAFFHTQWERKTGDVGNDGLSESIKNAMIEYLNS